ncbi:hypothetical protein ABNQ39_05645 [Azospirillum sp. A26]|uniref:hypothetical protein n=1 Tax=Azospirillum sp. A26 TaxID=3160607 RepID=UPI00367132FF
MLCGDHKAAHPDNIRAAFRKATKISGETAAKAMKLFRRSDDEASSDAEVAAALKALDRMAEAACMDRATFVDVCSELEEKKEEEKAKTPKAANPEFRESLAASMQEQLEALQRQVEALTSLLTKHGISVPAV